MVAIGTRRGEAKEYDDGISEAGGGRGKQWRLASGNDGAGEPPND